MPRVVKEFECSECSKIFDIKLNISVDGPRRIHCPNCGHIHFRSVSKGQITSTRCTNAAITEDIWPMKSSCRDFRKETEKDSDYLHSSSIDLQDGKKSAEAAQAFIHRLWKEKTSA